MNHKSLTRRQALKLAMASVSTLALWGCNQKSIENSIAEINKITEPTNTEVNEMIFNNVAQMKAATLAEGVVTSTVGYTSFNDGGQATYAVKTLVEFGSTPNELSDITLANGNVAVLMINGDAWNLKQFGAIGDDLADDTLSLQAMADKGGRMFMPRGVYRTSAQITFERFGYVYGESAGVGSGGGAWASLLVEAEQGATIIHPIVSGFTGGSVFNFEQPNADFKPLPAVSMSDFKIITERNGAVAAHMIQVVNAYDALYIRGVNLMFANKDFNALRLIEIDGGTFPSLSQTGVIESVVAIGEDDNTTATPVVYIRRQQEMQFIGLKSFGAAASVSPATPRIPIAVENCRGLTFVGCSSASTGGIGLDIYSTDVDTDGIYITGHTFEACAGGGWLLDGITRETAPHTLTNVQIRGSRYQFPQTIAGFMKACTFCVADVSTKETTLSDASANNTIYGQGVDKFTDTSGIGTNNVYIGNAIAGSVGYGQNSNSVVAKDSAQLILQTATGGFSHSLKSSKSSAGDNFGFQVVDNDTGSNMVLSDKGQLSLSSGDNTYIGIVMADETGTLKRLRLTSANTVVIANA